MIRTDRQQIADATKSSDACWRGIGVEGDRSCPRLAEFVHCRNCPVFSTAGKQLFDREAPPEYLDESTRKFSEAEEVAAAKTCSLLLFRIGPEWLALDACRVVEVVEPRAIHRVPHRTDRLLLGLVNIRGELHLCLSLHELLGIDSTEADATNDCASWTGPRRRLLVTEHDQEHWVFPVDEVEGVYRVPTAAMEDLPHTVQRSPRYYSEAIFSHGSKRVGRISTARLFQALERTFR